MSKQKKLKLRSVIIQVLTIAKEVTVFTCGQICFLPFTSTITPSTSVTGQAGSGWLCHAPGDGVSVTKVALKTAGWGPKGIHVKGNKRPRDLSFKGEGVGEM